jgi:hypothetical protein
MTRPQNPADRFLDLWEEQAGRQLAASWASLNQLMGASSDGRDIQSGAPLGPKAAGIAPDDRRLDLDELARRLADGAARLAALASDPARKS